MKKIIYGLSLGILGLCWLVPDHFPPWTAFHTEAPAFASVALIGFLLIQFNRIQITRAEICILVFMLIMSIQTFLLPRQYAGDGLVGIAYIGLIFIAHKWAKIDDERIDTFHLIQLLLIWVAVAVSFQAISQQLQITAEFGDWILEPLPDGRARANLGQSNQAATSIVLGVVAALALQARRQLGVPTTIFIQVYFAIAIAATQSRTAILAEVMICVYLIVFQTRQNGRRSSQVLALATLACLFFGYWLWMSYPIDLSEGASHAGLRTDPGTRGLIWKQFSIAITEKPLLGWGWGRIATAQQFGANAFPGTEQANYAHNILLDMFVTFGVPLTMVAVVFAVKWFFVRIPLIQREAQAYWALAMLIPLLVHSMLELPHAYSYFLVIAAMLVGILGNYGASGELVSFSKRLGLTIYSIWVVLILSIAYEYSLVEEDFRVNRFENRRIGVTPSEYVLPTVRVLTQYGDLLSAMRMRAAPDMPLNDVLLLEQVSERFTWAPLIFRSILASALNGREANAEKKLETLKNLFSKEVFDEAKSNIITLSMDKYPQLTKIDFPE